MTEPSSAVEPAAVEPAAVEPAAVEPAAVEPFVAGLCSVTLRGSPWREVIEVAAGAGLGAIEWGADVHVPPGDLDHAAAVGEATRDAGLLVGSYGSYLFAGPDLAAADVASVLDTAVALGAAWVRVWCPFGVEPGAGLAERAAVAEALADVVRAAVDRGRRVYVEFHGGTLTATERSAVELVAETLGRLPAGAPTDALALAWQPPYWDPTRPTGTEVGRAVGTDVGADAADGAGGGLAATIDAGAVALLGPHLAHVHVYAWDHDGTRHALAVQAPAWRSRLAAAALAGESIGGPRLALVEFVADDDPAAVADDAATLVALLAAPPAPAGTDRPLTAAGPVGANDASGRRSSTAEAAARATPGPPSAGGRAGAARASSGAPRPPAVAEAVGGREIVGMSAVLLPFTADGDIDWEGFTGLVERTLAAGLVPAMNMDTGFGPVLTPAERRRVLAVAADLCPDDPRGDRFLAGAHVDDAPGAALDVDGYHRAFDDIVEHGGTPIVFPSFGLAAVAEGEVADVHAALARFVDRFYGFELGPMFHPAGRIWDLDTFAAVLEIDRVVGAKHSSLRRRPELDRLALRDARRPGFRVLTGNDLAIDLVVHGSDYLLGLSAFAPDAFARRDRAFAAGDEIGFREANDVLQHLGQLAFRRPVPGYRHDAAMFLRRRGWIASDRTHPRSPRRPDADRPLLYDLVDRVEALVR